MSTPVQSSPSEILNYVHVFLEFNFIKDCIKIRKFVLNGYIPCIFCNSVFSFFFLIFSLFSNVWERATTYMSTSVFMFFFLFFHIFLFNFYIYESLHFKAKTCGDKIEYWKKFCPRTFSSKSERDTTYMSIKFFYVFLIFFIFFCLIFLFMKAFISRRKTTGAKLNILPPNFFFKIWARHQLYEHKVFLFF